MLSYSVGYMRASYLFIEATGFTSVVSDYFGSDDSLASFQSELAGNPVAGKVIPGAAPLRKTRWVSGLRGMGKRGGIRVIYIWIPDISVFYLLDVYGKDEAEDLSSVDKKQMKKLADRLVFDLRRRHQEGKL